MDFVFRRSYRGPLKAAIFDWAGTVMDYGCRAPAAVFVETFRREGIDITLRQARGPMGAAKREHIAILTREPAIAAAWRAKFGRDCAEADIDRMYAAFIPLQLVALPDYSDLIPGAVEAVADCRARGMKIGSTTGYDRSMLEICLRAAEKQGYVPDASVAASDVPAGRPHPWMAIRAAMEMGVHPFESIVKVGDTVPDIDEGLNGGMWTVAVVTCGNEVGLSEDEIAATPAAEFRALERTARERLTRAGAHHVIDSIGDLPAALDAIEAALRRGEKP